MTEALLQHLKVATETAETEASLLRTELSAAYEHVIRVKLVTWQYHEALVPLFFRLRRFHQITKAGLDHYLCSQVEDRLTLECEIKAYRERWGRHPEMDDGSPVVIGPHRKRRETEGSVSRGS